jgi:uncharacterized SAM-binding protein YcdF (DUF218 family)
MGMKIVKVVLVVVVIAFLVLCSAIQINFENYITDQNREYHILNNKKRISYIPVVAYFLKNVLLGRNQLDREISNCLYWNYHGRSIVSTGAKDEYIINCYFTDGEKEAIKQKSKF